MENDSNFMERIELYVWWVKNCSFKILPFQIKEEVEPLIEILETTKKITGINYSTLIFLYELQFFNFDLQKVKENEIKRKNGLAYFFA